MGTETTKALRARRRDSAARIDRLIARADEWTPMGSTRWARIKESARLARRRIKELTAAQQAVTAIEAEIGRWLLRVVDQGMSRNKAFELVGLSRHLGRRYVGLALRTPSRISTDFSPSAGAGDKFPAPGSDLDLDGIHPDVTTPGGKL